MKKTKKKSATLHPDGFIEPLADAIEAHPDFQDEYLDMAHRQMKKHNPGLHAVMMRVQKEQAAKGGS